VKKILAGAVSGAAALAVIFGSGVSHADNEFKGQTYERAAANIRGYGGTVVIAGRIGNYLPTEECVVTRSQSGESRKQLLYLNCNDASALNGHSGNSVATPEGKKVLQLREWGEGLSSDYKKSTESGKAPLCEKNFDWCVRTCTAAKNCSDEVLEYLGL
jgi:hypothetical protein